MNQDHFIALLLQHQDRIFAFVSVLIPRLSDAEDVSQQTCLILWKKRNEFDANRDFLAWARGIARNQARSYLRQHARERTTLSARILDQLADSATDAVNAFSERRHSLTVCVEKLQPEQRALLRDCYQGETSIKMVAAARNTPATALYMKLRRLRQLLIECVRSRHTRLE